MSNNFIIAPAPHLHSECSTRRIMLDVIYALVPALCVASLFFGWAPLMLTAIAVVSCVSFEWLIQRYLLKGERSIDDCSAILTGMLLAFNLPSNMPWWIVIIGSLVSIGVAKMSFGGVGKNPFNPALVGRVFLLISYPVQMTTFPRVARMTDALSGATPLSALRNGMSVNDFSLQDMLFGSIPGSMGEISALFLILGMLYLLWRKVITIHIPASILLTMWAIALLYSLCQGDSFAMARTFAMFHILAGGAVLGAIYMATDYSTSPMTHKGMMIYGVGIGAITMVIRLWGAYPEGVSFAILIMNAATPLINKYVKGERFGTKSSKA